MRFAVHLLRLNFVCALLVGGIGASQAGSTLAPASEYDVSSQTTAGAAAPAFQAGNPANELRLEFGAPGLAAFSERAHEAPWSVQLTPQAVTFGPIAFSLEHARVGASGNRVTYDFDQLRMSYSNSADGLVQILTIPSPPISDVEDGDEEDGAEAITVSVGITTDLKMNKAAYYVDLLGRDGKAALRYGAFRATDANGKSLEGGIELHRGIDGKALGVKLVVGGKDPAFPITVQTTLRRMGGTAESSLIGTEPVAEASDEIIGKPVELGMGITETVDSIMDREKLNPLALLSNTSVRPTHPEFEFEPKKVANPDAPNVSQWPPLAQEIDHSGPTLNSPQTVGTTFRAIILYDNAIAAFEAPAVPPDSMGDVGPTQILAAANGRIKVFDKAGTVGALNVADTTFWASLAPSGGASDPEVRYDRLSGRWFVLAIDLAATNNKIMLAVSSGATITGTGSFTFFSFTTSVTGDGANFCDFPSMGIDNNAIYGGCNMFTGAGAFSRTSAYVIRKSSVLGAGPIVVTGFGGIATGAVAGPYAPQGVDNDNPAWTEGYIIGVDTLTFSTLQIRRVSSPGGTPTLSGNLTLTVPTTTPMVRQWAPGVQNNNSRIDASDDRVYKGAIHKNKLTGVTSLWIAQGVEVNTAGTPLSTTTNDFKRIGARWYEIGNLTTTPTLTQSGTLFSNTLGASTHNTQRGYLFPTVAETGQGHMALGATYASSTEFLGAAAAGRLRTDTLGTTQAATIAFAGTEAYRLCDGTNGACPRNRWGDYSFTDVDPTDDQTVWTFQEYATTSVALTIGNGNWGIRAIQLKAPGPATPVSASPSSVCTGLPSIAVTITGTSSGGTEFFDPGSDPVPYANHIAAAVTGGVTVNSAAIVIPGSPGTTPVTQVNLSLNTSGASLGAKNVTITNPDGQSAVGNGILTIVSAPATPTPSNNGPICNGATLQLSTATVPGATYSWTGPNGFVSSAQNPTIPGATTAATGTYNVTVTAGGCSSAAGGTSATVTGTGGACGSSSTSACDNADTCNGSGVCQPNNVANGTNCGDAGSACVNQDTCQAGVCQDNGFAGAGTACGSPSSGACDNADTCNGAGVCQPNNVANGTNCGDAGSACVNQDTCQAGVCQDNGFAGAGTACGSPSSGACDNADTCNGSGVCQPNNVANGTNCGDAGSACVNQDTCQAGVCQDNGFAGAGTACGSPSSNACDNADTCDGAGGCSVNHVADGSSCGDAGSACVNQDTCLAGACQDNGFTGAGTACGDPSSGACDNADTCDGAGGCSVNHVGDGTMCGPTAAECDNQDTCLSGACHDNGFAGAGTACGSASSGACDNADTCDGAGGCSVNHVADGTNCGDAGSACVNQDTCQAGVCQDNGFAGAGTACGSPSSGACDNADTCDGAGGCSVNHVADGTNCGDAGSACVNQDTCLTGACQDNGFAGAGTACGSPSSDACDNADTCDGAGGCSVNHVADGTACGDAGSACVNQDNCLAGACHDNGFAGAGTACGSPTSGPCDNPDACDGAGGCSTNHVADGTSCSDSDPTTCSDMCGGGTCAGTFVAEPSEINSSVRASDKVTVVWTDPSGPYNVYRGSNGAGSWSYDQTCYSPNQAGSSVSDGSDPALGSFYYYLISRVNVCRESVIGRDSGSSPDPNTSPCIIP